MQITSLLSILHRLCELLLYGLSLMFIVLMGGALLCPLVLDTCVNAFPLVWGLIIAFIVSSSLVFYFLASLRYIAWDWGWGFSLPAIHATGWGASLAALLGGIYTLLSLR